MKIHKSLPAKKIVPLVVMAIIVGGVWTILAHRTEGPTNTVVANGTIEATEIDISPKVSGHIVKLTVDEGDHVQAGQVIAVIDGDEVKAQVEQSKGALDAAKAHLSDLAKGSREEDVRQAQADLQQAQAAASGALTNLSIANETYAKSTELKARYVNAKAGYDAAKHACDQAKARLDEIEHGTRIEELHQGEADVAQAKAQKINADEDAKRAEKLYAAGAISGQARDAAVTKRDASNAALDAAEARLAELRAGARSEQREQAKAALAQAKAQLEGSKLNYDAVKELYNDRLQLKQQVEAARTQYDTAKQQVDAARAHLDLLVAGPTKQAIDVARGQVEQASGTLSAAKATEQYLVVRAPESGTVILKSAELGEMVTPGMPIVRIASLGSVWVRVYVPLPKLDVRIGDKADVVTDAYSGRKFHGRVTEISDKPEFTPKNIQTQEQRVKLVYGVKVKLDNREHMLKPGMPADATIYLNGKHDGRR